MILRVPLDLSCPTNLEKVQVSRPSPFQLMELELQPGFKRHLHQNRIFPLISLKWDVQKCRFQGLNSVIHCHHLFLLATRGHFPAYADIWKLKF